MTNAKRPRLRLLWVTLSLPRRGQSALQERTWALLNALTPDHDVTLLAFVTGDDTAVPAEELPPGLAAVQRIACAPQWTDDPLSLLPPTVRAGLADPRCRAAVASLLEAEPFDVVQYELIEMGHVMPAPTVPTILSVHQLGHAQAQPQWEAAGRHLTGWPAMWFRRARDTEFERRALRRAHRIVALSHEDAARIRPLRANAPISIVPMGVDCTTCAPRPATPSRCDILFVGHFAHPPNVDAAIFLVRDVLPRLGRPVRVRIVGHAPTAAVRALTATPGVEVTGSVPDVRDELAAARVVVAPVRFGTGMRGKVLEALAMGRPVVTTPLGAEGLGAVDGHDLLLANDAPAYAAAITRVLDEATLANTLSQAGRTLAVTRFDWPVVVAAQLAAYTAVASDPAPQPLPWVDQVSPWLRRCGQLGYLPAVVTGAAIVAMRTLTRPHRT